MSKRSPSSSPTKGGKRPKASAEASTAAAAGAGNGAEYVTVTPFQHTARTSDPPPKPGPVRLSKTDKGTQVKLEDDGMTMLSQRGYRMARATHGVREGCWYFEVKVQHLGDTGHARIGWCTTKADVQAPTGSDAHGFAYRDLEGSRVHEGLRHQYGEGFVEGDVVGCYIYLPPCAAAVAAEPAAPKELVTFKGAPYEVEKPEQPPVQVQGSVVAFSKNGVMQGVAFRDVPQGEYFPSGSLYTLPDPAQLAALRFNFGPDFAFQPAAVEAGLPLPAGMADVAPQPPQPAEPSEPSAAVAPEVFVDVPVPTSTPPPATAAPGAPDPAADAAAATAMLKGAVTAAAAVEPKA